MTDEEQWSRALRLLREGRYAEAWPLFEARRRIARIDTWEPDTVAAEWTGQDLAGRRVMVLAEQGFGDQLMFGRYLPLLRELGAEVVVWCNPRYVARLFEAAGFATTPGWTDRPLPACDHWVQIGSLPLRLGASAPPPPAYLPVRPGGVGAGVMAAGNPAHARDAQRSLPADFAARLRAMGRDLAPERTGALDFLDTAEILGGLAEVIAVDTAVVHLAGAMGKACTVLLDHDADFRWGLGARSDWYPDFRLVRQAAPGDWAGVFAELERGRA